MKQWCLTQVLAIWWIWNWKDGNKWAYPPQMKVLVGEKVYGAHMRTGWYRSLEWPSLKQTWHLQNGCWKTGSTISTLLHDKINPKDCQVVSLGDSGFLQFFRVVSSDYGKPRMTFLFPCRAQLLPGTCACLLVSGICWGEALHLRSPWKRDPKSSAGVWVVKSPSFSSRGLSSETVIESSGAMFVFSNSIDFFRSKVMYTKIRSFVWGTEILCQRNMV